MIPLNALSAMRHELEKRAEDKPELKEEHPAVSVAKSIGGFGAGIGAGYLAARGINAVLRSRGMNELPAIAYKALPLMTAAGGMAYTAAQQRTLHKMRQGHLERQQQKG